jgi:hypothetical protein
MHSEKRWASELTHVEIWQSGKRDRDLHQGSRVSVQLGVIRDAVQVTSNLLHVSAPINLRVWALED